MPGSPLPDQESCLLLPLPGQNWYGEDFDKVFDRSTDCHIVPNDRKYLESLPGVGRKTTNVVLKNIYNEPSIPVDTHVERVSKRLGFAKTNDSVSIIEKKLMKKIPKEKWNRVSEQILLFGRYYCKSVNPNCDGCKFKSYCKYKKNS